MAAAAENYVVREWEAVYVVDSRNNRLVEWGTDADAGAMVAGRRRGDHHLTHPRGVAVERDGSVLVADTDNNRVVRWQRGAQLGEVVAGGNDYGNGFNQLAGPCGVAVERGGSLLVADTGNHRVVRWRADDQEGEVVVGHNVGGVSVAVPLMWDRRTHRLFRTKTREVVMSVLLCMSRIAQKPPEETLLKVLLPMAMDAAWVTPQELWELEDSEVVQ